MHGDNKSGNTKSLQLQNSKINVNHWLLFNSFLDFFFKIKSIIDYFIRLIIRAL